MAQAVDIREAIQRSTSDISIQDLSKKGCKQGKVLNQATIARLIAEAVDKVISDRAAEISEAEREKVVAESRKEFGVLAKQRMDEHAQLQRLQVAKEQVEERVGVLQERISDLEARLAERDRELEATRRRSSEGEQRDRSVTTELKQEVDQLRGRLAESEKVAAVLEGRLEAKDEELARLRESGGGSFEQLVVQLQERFDSIRASGTSDTTDEIKKSLAGIQQNILNLSRGPISGGVGADCDAEALVMFAERGLGDGTMETNMDEVEIKESKSSGVKSSLAKLKALQQGAKGQE